MDVDSLQAELEQHLSNNPHEDAPGGFRDRFSVVAEQHAAGGGNFPPSVLEAQLKQIRDEAKAAVNAANVDGGGASDPGVDTGAAPSGGFLQRFGLALFVILILLVAAFLYFR